MQRHFGSHDRQRSRSKINLKPYKSRGSCLGKKKVLENPIQIKGILASLSEQLGKNITKDILKRFLKKLRYSYRRIRQWVKGEPDPQIYKQKVQELATLIALEKNQFLTIYYGDESGFSTTPCVPYGWQLIDEPMTIPTERSKRRNVFGLMSKSGDLWTYSPKKKWILPL